MTRLFVFAGVVFALMVVVKDGRALRSVGLFGSCRAVTTSAGAAAESRECREGKLDGFPDLSRDACRSVRIVGPREWWSCPLGLTPEDR